MFLSKSAVGDETIIMYPMHSSTARKSNPLLLLCATVRHEYNLNLHFYCS